MSDTPRTDECTYPADCLGKTLVVNADLAKSLERELKQTWEALFDIGKITGELRDKRDKLERELKDANHRLDAKRAMANYYKNETERVRKRMDEVIKIDEDEAAIAADTIKTLKAENAELRAKVAAQGLSLACLADGILGEDASDRSDQTLVAVGCRMARENATLRAALDAQMKYQRDLRADRDRLDSRRMRLMVHVEGNVWKTHEFVDVDLRAAIDSAQKEQP